jgi:hypothetical protein
MVDQLSAFASEVTRVALEVGTQGILGGQARVEGVQGTWADLTRNVNVRHRTSYFLRPGVPLAGGHDAHARLLLENGLESDGPGALDLRGHQGRRAGRPRQARQRRCAGRDAGPEDDRQLHGGAVEHAGERGHACELGGRHGGYPGWPGVRPRCPGHVEGASETSFGEREYGC